MGSELIAAGVADWNVDRPVDRQTRHFVSRRTPGLVVVGYLSRRPVALVVLHAIRDIGAAVAGGA